MNILYQDDGRGEAVNISMLKETVSYDPETGVLRWKRRTAFCVKVGSVIGSVSDRGYIRFNIDKKSYYGHRVAFALMTGCVPVEVDHKNGNRLDNRWDNLREATRSINCQNRRSPNRQSSTGYLGVTTEKNKFRAQIHFGGENHRLGTFDTAAQAHQAYLSAKRKFHDGCEI